MEDIKSLITDLKRKINFIEKFQSVYQKKENAFDKKYNDLLQKTQIEMQQMQNAKEMIFDTKMDAFERKYEKLQMDMEEMQYEKNSGRKSLTLIDVEEFLPLLLMDKHSDGIGEDENFIINQYTQFLKITDSDAMIQYDDYNKLKKFEGLILADNEAFDKNRNKLRRNYLYNLVYHKYQYDIASIESSNVFLNYYFEPKNNGMIKQCFVASVQILFTVLLFIEIMTNIQVYGIDFGNDLNIVGAIVIMYLVCILIKPSISSIVRDLRIVDTYFQLKIFSTILNILANVVVAVLMPIVTFFVILSSQSIGDVVLNATAIAFIIELDDDAAIEIDLGNWFVTVTLEYENIFKEHIPLNEVPMRDSIQKKYNHLMNAIKNLNAKLEYDDLEWKVNVHDILIDLFHFLLAPISIFFSPLYDLHQVLWKRQNNANVIKQSVTDATTIQPKFRKKSSSIPTKQPRTMMSYNLLSTQEEDVKEEEKQMESVQEKHIDKQVSQTVTIHDALTNTRAYNERGNEAVCRHAFNEAYIEYQEAINCLLSIDQLSAKQQHFLSVLYYNKGYASYKRAKKSWISETLTNKNGYTYRNYMEALDCFEKSKENMNMETMNDYAQKRRFVSINLICSNIYYDIFDFTPSKQCYQEYEKYNKDLFNEDTNHQRYTDIAEKEEIQVAQGKKKYLKLLDDFAEYAYHEEKHESNQNPIQTVVDILNDEHDIVFRNNEMLSGKYHFVLSEYYGKLDKDKEFDHAQKAHNVSSIYGLRLINAASNYDASDESSFLRNDELHDLCTQIITAFTNHIEFDQNEEYYYYCRGVAYYKLSKLKEESKVFYLEKASKDFESAIKLDDNCHVFRLRLAFCKYVLGQFDEAKIIYDEAIQCITKPNPFQLFIVAKLETLKSQLFASYFRVVKDPQKISSKEEWGKLSEWLSENPKLKISDMQKKYSVKNELIVQSLKWYKSIHFDDFDDGIYFEAFEKIVFSFLCREALVEFEREQRTSKYIRSYSEETQRNNKEMCDIALAQYRHNCGSILVSLGKLLKYPFLKDMDELLKENSIHELKDDDGEEGFTYSEWIHFLSLIPNFVDSDILDFKTYATNSVIQMQQFIALCVNVSKEITFQSIV